MRRFELVTKQSLMRGADIPMLYTFADSISVPTQNDQLAKQHPRHRLWQLHLDDAKRFSRTGQHRKARQKLRAALKEALHFGENDERLATTLTNLVVFEGEQYDGELSIDQTLTLANDAVRVNKICFGEGNEKTASCLVNVGVLLEDHRLFDEANAALAEAVLIFRDLKEKTQDAGKLLCYALYSRASLLWSHQSIAFGPEEVLRLADEAYTLGKSLFGPEDRLVAAVKCLTDDVKLARRIRGQGDYDLSGDDTPTSQGGSCITLPEGGIASQLAAAGESLPESLQASLLGRGPEIVPELIAILENDGLAMLAAPGGGHLPLHAVELLSDLGAIESAESMLQVLSRCDWLDLLHDALTNALQSFGAAVLEPALRSYTAAQNQDQREAVAEVLAGIGVRDQRVLSIVLAVFRENTELGAGLLARYGDPVALPQLSAALDKCRFDPEGEAFADQDVIEIADAISVLGGTLTESQKILLEQVHRAGDHWRKAFLWPAGSGTKRN